MARRPKDPKAARVTSATKLTFQQDVILEQISAKTGYSRSQLLRMAVEPLVAAASSNSPDQFEQWLMSKVFVDQCRQIDKATEIFDTIEKRINHSSLEHFEGQRARTWQAFVASAEPMPEQEDPTKQ